MPRVMRLIWTSLCWVPYLHDGHRRNHFFCKFKLMGKCKFNHLIITLKLPSSVSLNSILIDETKHVKYLIKIMGELTKLRFNSKTFDSNNMLNHNFFFFSLNLKPTCQSLVKDSTILSNSSGPYWTANARKVSN